MGEDSDILSDPEPIDDHEATPEQDSAEDDAGAGFWEVDAARKRLQQAASEAADDPGQPFERGVLEAAATLREKSRPDYARAKQDLKPYVNMNQWPGVVKDVARELKTESRRVGDTRPVIRKDPDRAHETIDQAVDALQDVEGLYQRGGEIVEIRQREEGAEIVPVEKGKLYRYLAEAARFEQPTEDGARAIEPPRRLVNAVHDEGQWGLDELDGLVDGAAFLEDGTILTTPGYHPDPGLYLRHGTSVSGLQSPSQEDAEQAREVLVDLLVDFEFVDDAREAHESAWLAALLTILARPAIGARESTPLFLFDANRPGVGKTRLVELACEIAMGHLPAPRPAPTGRNADDEMRKTITAIARAGVPVVFFDNVKGKLGGGSLELALTGSKWSSRILQKSEDWSGPLNVTWLATSNNASLTPDMRRRTLLCRIETDRQSPQERKAFKYPRIQQHVREHRSRYLTAALTILRAWHVAGQPDAGLTPWGSFEEWSRIVRNAVVFAGGADPYQTRDSLERADRETSLLRAVLETWPSGERFTASQLAEGMRDGELETSTTLNAQEVIGPLKELVGSTKARGVGRQLGYYEGRNEGGKKLVQERESGTGKKYWTVQEVGCDDT